MFHLFQGGGWYLLGIQLLGTVSIASWTLVVSYLILKTVDLTLGFRVTIEHELIGADAVEHNVGQSYIAKTCSNALTASINISNSSTAINCKTSNGLIVNRKFQKDNVNGIVDGECELNSLRTDRCIPSTEDGEHHEKIHHTYTLKQYNPITDTITTNTYIPGYSRGIPISKSDDLKTRSTRKNNLLTRRSFPCDLYVSQGPNNSTRVISDNHRVLMCKAVGPETGTHSTETSVIYSACI